MGRQAKKIHPQAAPLLPNSGMEFGHKSLKKLMQAVLAAFKLLSCSIQLLRYSSQARRD